MLDRRTSLVPKNTVSKIERRTSGCLPVTSALQRRDWWNRSYLRIIFRIDRNSDTSQGSSTGTVIADNGRSPATRQLIRSLAEVSLSGNSISGTKPDHLQHVARTMGPTPEPAGCSSHSTLPRKKCDRRTVASTTGTSSSAPSVNRNLQNPFRLKRPLAVSIFRNLFKRFGALSADTGHPEFCD